MNYVMWHCLSNKSYFPKSIGPQDEINLLEVAGDMGDRIMHLGNCTA